MPEEVPSCEFQGDRIPRILPPTCVETSTISCLSIGNLIGTNYHDTYCHIFDAVRPKCCTKGGTKPPRYTSALPGVDAVASSLANRQAPDAGMRSFGS